MAPKKQGRRTTAVVTSRKVVEKTVQVVVTPGNQGGGVETEKQQPCSASSVAAEVVSLLSKEEPTVHRTVSVECNTGDPPAARMTKKRKRAAGGGGEAEYKRYVYKVLKQVHPDLGISARAMAVINNLMADMFERIAAEAAALAKYVSRRTLSSREIQDAVKLVLPGELGKHAVAEGAKAVAAYAGYINGGGSRNPKSPPSKTK
ncbi:hypothetical protein DM860_000204 [Cuscuta australis]|uniref:Core Histone H2A/H2B/H3 domain-containing protein n=1 Tax=Cuscuta australis TaxID=267555 RepID=A0A328CXV9_9ASTE|nr:hypothetical protein DM860_000204 [Cuscuta australis]